MNHIYLPYFLVALFFSHYSFGQEYFESFVGEEVDIPAYSEYHQNFNFPENSKAFLATYTDGIIQYQVYPSIKPIDTLKIESGYIKAFDYESYYNQSEELLVFTTSEKKVGIYDLKEKQISQVFDMPFMLNDIQFSNIKKDILWGADIRGNIVKIDLVNKNITLHKIHDKGIARIELFMDKIITSSFDHTVRVTNQNTLVEEQKIKFQVPALEFDVSCDGIIAMAAARGVSIYSIIDKKWLYGKNLMKKKAQTFEGDKDKYYWNPYVNEDDYWFAGVTKKITFLRHGHTIATCSPYEGLYFTELNNPGLLIPPKVANNNGMNPDNVWHNYLFNQDNHLTFFEYEFDYNSEYDPKPYDLDPKAKYIKKIDPNYGLWSEWFPFSYEIEEKVDFAMGYDFEITYQVGNSNLLTLDNLDVFKDSIRTNPIHLSKYHIDHFIPFPTVEYDTFDYADRVTNMLSFEVIDMCQEDLELGTVIPECLIENKWLYRDTAYLLLEEESLKLAYSMYDDDVPYEALEVRDKVILGVAKSVDQYIHGFPETETNQNTLSESNLYASSNLYLDDKFELMDQKGHLSKVESFAISPDQKYIATGGQDCKIILWDFYSGLKIKELDYGIKGKLNEKWVVYETEWDYGFTHLIFHPLNTWIIASHRSYGSVCWDYQTNQIIGYGPNFRYANISADGRFLFDESNEIYELPSLKYIDSYEGDYYPAKTIKGNTEVIEQIKNKNISIYTSDYSGSELESIQREIYRKSDGGIQYELYADGLMSPDQNWYVIEDVIFDKKTQECYNLEDFNQQNEYHYTPIYLQGEFSPDSKYFAYVANKKLKVFDLEQRIFSTITDSTVYKFANPVKFSPDGQYLICKVWEIKGGELNWLEEANTNRTLGIYDVATQRKLRHHKGHPVERMDVVSDSTERYLLFKGVDFLYTLDRETLEIQQLKLKQESKRYSLGIEQAIFKNNTDGIPVVVGVLAKTFGNGSYYNDFEWHPSTGYFKKLDEDELNIDFFSVANEHSYLIRDYNEKLKEVSTIWNLKQLREIYINEDTNQVIKLDTNAFLKYIKQNETGAQKLSGSFDYSNFSSRGPYAVSKDHQSIYLPTKTHGIGKYSLPDFKELAKWNAHNEHPLSFNIIGDEMISIGNDGNVILWDISATPPTEKLRFYGDKDGLFMISPDYYYAATKENIDFVSFRKGNNFIPISSFDVKYNRPDLILKKLNSSNSELIDAYEKAYHKRLKRLNISENDLEIENLPEINIQNLEYLPKFTNDQTLELFITATDNLKDINLWVNGVAQKTNPVNKEEYTSITVKLVSGLNEIEIVGITSDDKTTLPSTYTLEHLSEKNQKQNLFVLSIGVSEYQQNDFNLSYAAKDANDVSEVFSSLTSFNQVNKLTLTDQQVTNESIDQINAFLAKASINDVIVVYLAGHGLLDENFDYYFAVHDVDFNNPAEKGWSYQFLEKLMSTCEANKKLLLFDTCHGGEIDKDELALNTEENEETGDVTFRSGKQFNYTTPSSNASELSKSFFGDFRKGVGATVIASSGGTEYAAESDTYQNGIFTYYLRKGLTDNEADLDLDGMITVNELRSYLNESVRKATNGKQNPGTRILNDKHQIILKR